jgi:hypothetical protein
VRGERRCEGGMPGRGNGRRADSIDDMDLLRHGAMSELFGGICASSTLDSHLRGLPEGTSVSWRRPAGSSRRGWLGRRRCCPARTPWPKRESCAVP